jgi:hypothetical protein
MKVVFGLDAKDGPKDFLNATKDCQKKFVSRTQTNVGDDDEPLFLTKAYATSRHTVYFAEGMLSLSEFEGQVQDEHGNFKQVDIFGEAGFVYVRKIVED